LDYFKFNYEKTEGDYDTNWWTVTRALRPLMSTRKEQKYQRCTTMGRNIS